jgi:hypothetical protein
VRALEVFAAKLQHAIETGVTPAFDAWALELFALQFEQNAAYRTLCRDRTKPASWREIPPAPTVAFKELELTSIPPADRIKEFRSSGTTADKPSRHFHSTQSLRLYEALLAPALRQNFAADGLSFISLTPSPKDAPYSSLVHMFNTLNPTFVGRIDWSVGTPDIRGSVGLMGTAFNFVHLIDSVQSLPLPRGSRVLETGGYKGRSREVSRTELHMMIRRAFGISEIITEYGMCELSSQAYARDDGWLRFPPWARVQIVSPENGREVTDGEAGLVRIFDLANVWSVLAIQTGDLAVRRGDAFELIGRVTSAEARGCSLMSR